MSPKSHGSTAPHPYRHCSQIPWVHSPTSLQDPSLTDLWNPVPIPVDGGLFPTGACLHVLVGAQLILFPCPWGSWVNPSWIPSPHPCSCRVDPQEILSLCPCGCWVCPGAILFLGPCRFQNHHPTPHPCRILSPCSCVCWIDPMPTFLCGPRQCPPTPCFPEQSHTISLQNSILTSLCPLH